MSIRPQFLRHQTFSNLVKYKRHGLVMYREDGHPRQPATANPTKRSMKVVSMKCSQLPVAALQINLSSNNEDRTQMST